MRPSWSHRQLDRYCIHQQELLIRRMLHANKTREVLSGDLGCHLLRATSPLCMHAATCPRQDTCVSLLPVRLDQEAVLILDAASCSNLWSLLVTIKQEGLGLSVKMGNKLCKKALG